MGAKSGGKSFLKRHSAFSAQISNSANKRLLRGLTEWPEMSAFDPFLPLAGGQIRVDQMRELADSEGLWLVEAE